MTKFHPKQVQLANELPKPVGEGISELRIDYGPGYRMYFIQRGLRVVILLCGGDKSAQMHDIDRAKTIAKTWRELNHE